MNQFCTLHRQGSCKGHQWRHTAAWQQHLARNTCCSFNCSPQRCRVVLIFTSIFHFNFIKLKLFFNKKVLCEIFFKKTKKKAKRPRMRRQWTETSSGLPTAGTPTFPVIWATARNVQLTPVDNDPTPAFFTQILNFSMAAILPFFKKKIRKWLWKINSFNLRLWPVDLPAATVSDPQNWNYLMTRALANNYWLT